MDQAELAYRDDMEFGSQFPHTKVVAVLRGYTIHPHNSS